MVIGKYGFEGMLKLPSHILYILHGPTFDTTPLYAPHIVQFSYFVPMYV